MHLLLPVLRKAIAKGVGHIRGRYGTSGGGEFREGRGDVLAARIEQAQAPMPVPGGVRPEFPRARDDLVHDLDDGERRQLLDELLGDAQPRRLRPRVSGEDRVVEVEQDGFGEFCQGQLSECATFSHGAKPACKYGDIGRC